MKNIIFVVIALVVVAYFCTDASAQFQTCQWPNTCG